MTEQQLKSFELLKKKVETTFQGHVTTCQEAIQNWKGKQIAQFQEDLRNQVGGYVSEKWFYTHLKTVQNEKLPREDMLDMLARYVGAANWNDFIISNKPEEKEGEEPLKKTAKKTAANIWMLLIILVSIIGLMVLLSFFQPKNTYRFCIVDEDDGQAIPTQNIEAFWIKKGETPFKLPVDTSGCVVLENLEATTIDLKVEALYYKPLMITRKLTLEGGEETIALKKDDYALMIHYFSMHKMEDWKKRREQLGQMLSDNARIVQVDGATQGGMALYNKQEFINKMTMPLKSLKNIEILETKYEGDQIIEIRFVQKNESK